MQANQCINRHKLIIVYNTGYGSFKLISSLLFKGIFQIAAGYEQRLLLFFLPRKFSSKPMLCLHALTYDRRLCEQVDDGSIREDSKATNEDKKSAGYGEDPVRDVRAHVVVHLEDQDVVVVVVVGAVVGPVQEGEEGEEGGGVGDEARNLHGGGREKANMKSLETCYYGPNVDPKLSRDKITLQNIYF